MKKNRIFFKQMFWSLAVGVLILSCESQETEEELSIDAEVISATQLQFSDEGEQISDGIFEVVEDVFADKEILKASKVGFRSKFLPECAVVTTDSTATTKTRIIDFGTGCELRNGNILSGQIQMQYERDAVNQIRSIAVSLQDFTFNEVAVVGTKSILRVQENENGNPQSTAATEFTATWPEGESATIVSTKSREWIAGFDTEEWADNVYLISGTGTFTNRNGESFSKEISQPLRRELACRFIVSGEVNYTRNGATSSLNFGSGECDASALLTKADGTQKEIMLRRFKRKGSGINRS